MSAIHVNSNNFEQVVLNSDKPVLVDFWAPWCVPCRMQSPVVEQVAEELKETAVVAKVDVDESPKLAAEFSVMSIPTLLVFKDKKSVDRRTGLTPKAKLLAMIEAAGS